MYCCHFLSFVWKVLCCIPNVKTEHLKLETNTERNCSTNLIHNFQKQEIGYCWKLNLFQRENIVPGFKFTFDCFAKYTKAITLNSGRKIPFGNLFRKFIVLPNMFSNKHFHWFNKKSLLCPWYFFLSIFHYATIFNFLNLKGVFSGRLKKSLHWTQPPTISIQVSDENMMQNKDLEL